MYLRLARYLIAAAALAGAYCCALFARAAFLFQRDTADSVAAAVRLVPYNSEYIAHLAAWLPGHRLALFHRAVELNPFDYETWIQLGLAAEIQQRDLASAERYYLRAAEVNHMFLPKWTLTNFYFRQQNKNEFFRWAKATLAITPLSANPVFGQMWLLSANAQQIAWAIPDRAGILLEYSYFLANRNQFAALPPIVSRIVALAKGHNPAQYGRDDHIGPIEDRILAAGDLEPALRIWSSMKEGGWIHFAIPTPQHPLTDGDFQSAPFQHGFDWIPICSTGITIDRSTEQKTLRIAFSGDEPENTTLMRQYVPLDSSHSYRLTWQANAEGIDTPSGLAWHISPSSVGSQSNIASGDLLTPNSGNWDFKTSGTADVYVLSLDYSRPIGSLRVNGSIAVRSVALTQN